MAAAKYPQRKIGDASVSAIGLGCMGMSFGYTSYGGYDDEESLKVLTRAADAGVTFWDTSDIYGPFTNEKLIGKWFATTGRRQEIFLATKFANRFIDGKMEVFGDKEYVKKGKPLLSHFSPRPEANSCPSLRRVPGTTPDESHRPVLPAPGRPQDTHRGDGIRHGRAGQRGQGAQPGPV